MVKTCFDSFCMFPSCFAIKISQVLGSSNPVLWYGFLQSWKFSFLFCDQSSFKYGHHHACFATTILQILGIYLPVLRPGFPDYTPVRGKPPLWIRNPAVLRGGTPIPEKHRRRGNQGRVTRYFQGNPQNPKKTSF